jgi:hypothetical protein
MPLYPTLYTNTFLVFVHFLFHIEPEKGSKTGHFTVIIILICCKYSNNGCNEHKSENVHVQS